MQSRTLSCKGLFSPALFRNNLSRFWPLWVVYLVGWLLMMPASQFLHLFGNDRHWIEAAELQSNAVSHMLSLAGPVTIVFSVGFGCLFVMALYSYLTTVRSIGFIHTLPIRRQGLFFTHYVTGVVVFLATHTIVALLTMAIWSAAGIRDFWAIGLWFLSAGGQMLFFYGLSVFCAMFAGHILAIPVFYGAFNVLAAGITALVNFLCESSFYGWSYSEFPTIVKWLTPVYKLMVRMDVLWRCNPYDGVAGGREEAVACMGTVGIYTFAGLALSLVALVVYCHRKSESAGDVVAINWAKPIFRYGVGFCSALSFGQLLYNILQESFYRGGERANIPMLTICLVVTGLVGYFGAEMLLQKSFRVFKKGWKGGAVMTGVLLVLCISFPLDPLGVQRYVPEVDDVSSLDFSIYGYGYINGTVSDPEVISRFLDLHHAVTEQQPKDDWKDSGTQNAGLHFNYTMKNGDHVSRDYSFSYYPEEINQSGSVVSKLVELNKDPDVRMADIQEQMLNDMERLTSAELDMYQLNGEWDKKISFEADTAEKLMDALKKDIEAGHVGVDAFDQAAWDQNTYINDLVFYYRVKKTPDNEYRYNNNEGQSFCLEFSNNYTYLLQALEEAGVQTDQLITHSKNRENPDKFTDGQNELYPETAARETEVIGGADGVTVIDHAEIENSSSTQES